MSSSKLSQFYFRILKYWFGTTILIALSFGPALSSCFYSTAFLEYTPDKDCVFSISVHFPSFIYTDQINLTTTFIMRPTSIGKFNISSLIDRFSHYIGQARGYTNLPTQTYTLDFQFGISLESFDLMIQSVIQNIAGNVHCVKDLRSIYGNTWEQGVIQSFYNELYCVAQWLEFVKLKDVAIPNFKSFCVDELNVGAARILELANKQPDVFPSSLSPYFNRGYARYSYVINSDDIKGWVEAHQSWGSGYLTIAGSNGINHLDSNTLYTFGCIRKNFPDYQYNSYDFDNYSPLQYSLGDFIYKPNGYSYLDTREDINVMSIALNTLYLFEPLNDWTVVLQSNPFNSFNDVLNLPLHSQEFCEIYTGLKGLGSDLGYANIEAVPFNSQPPVIGPIRPDSNINTSKGYTNKKRSSSKYTGQTSDPVARLLNAGKTLYSVANDLAGSPLVQQALNVAAKQHASKSQAHTVRIEGPEHTEVSFHTPLGTGRATFPKNSFSRLSFTDATK